VERDSEESSEISRYASAGIEERHGRVPRWLLGVYVVLLIWMVYYLVRFWTDKG
jgi:N-terminal domain of cytochrome oxidase-cbb3, FixP